MVSYQRWTEAVFDAAPASADATDVISFAAQEWRKNKADLQAASVAEAEAHARAIV